MSKFVVMADWDDVPHLSAIEKEELIASIPPHQREARTKGVPQLGSGAIFPVPETDVVVEDFTIPDHYARGYGLDVGWNCTAAVWMAHDRETGVRYIYNVHKRGEAEPSIHADAVRSRGAWPPRALTRRPGDAARKTGTS